MNSRIKAGRVSIGLLVGMFAGAGVLSAGESVTQTSVSSAVAAEELSVEQYQKIVALRSELGLDEGTLLASNWTAAEFRQVLTNLKQWQQSHGANLDQATIQKAQKQQELQELIRKINVGPRDAGLLGQVSSVKQAAENAAAARQDLINAALEQITVSVSYDSKQAWRALREGRGSRTSAVQKSAQEASALTKSYEQIEQEILPMPATLKLEQERMLNAAHSSAGH